MDKLFGLGTREKKCPCSTVELVSNGRKQSSPRLLCEMETLVLLQELTAGRVSWLLGAHPLPLQLATLPAWG